MNVHELIPGIEPHNDLNPEIWENEQLRPDVREALMNIAEKFYSYLGVDVEVQDVIITGSQSSYNYTDHSDLDLHLIVPYSSITCDQPVEELLDTKRKLWKLQHDINIHGIPVELYAEDTEKPVTGSTYSVIQDQWLIKPERAESQPPEGVEKTAKAWIIMITKAIEQDDLAKLKDLKQMLMTYRQKSLDARGEMSKGNLVFKMLRNSGAVANLMGTISQLEDRALSLPE